MEGDKNMLELSLYEYWSTNYIRYIRVVIFVVMLLRKKKLKVHEIGKSNDFSIWIILWSYTLVSINVIIAK